MLNKEERELRRTQVGASDVPYLMNFDTKRAKDLWKEKIGELERAELDNKYITFGNLTEEDCLNFYLKDSEYTLNERIEHSTIKNFVASTDGLRDDSLVIEYKYITDGSPNVFKNLYLIPIENKGKNERGWTKLTKPDKDHLIQVMAQIACLNAPYGEIVYNRATEEDYEHPLLYIPSEEKQKVFIIDRDVKLINEIENRVKYFMECTKNRKEPSESEYKEKFNE